MSGPLNEDLVREIVRLYTERNLGERNIARIIDRNEHTVRDVLRGRTWKHITGGRLTNGRRPGVVAYAVYE